MIHQSKPWRRRLAILIHNNPYKAWFKMVSDRVFSHTLERGVLYYMILHHIRGIGSFNQIDVKGDMKRHVPMSCKLAGA
jgi:hypothetical protein